MFIARQSIASNKVRSLDVPCTTEELARYEQGMPAQKAFPKLSAAFREYIISGMTRSEWIEVYGENDPSYGVSSPS
jgi:hypothetical protein